MLARSAFAFQRACSIAAKPSQRVFVQKPVSRGVTAVATAGARSSRTRSFLGTTAGTVLFVFSGSVLVWPIADLFLGPKLVMLGMKSNPGAAGANPAASSSVAMLPSDWSGKKANVTVVSAAPGFGKQLEHLAAQAGRPVVYITLREATSPHDLYFAMLTGVYSANRLGCVGTLAHSMGVWWIVLFDVMVGHELDKTRAFHLSVILQHLRRALRSVSAEHSSGLSASDHLRAQDGSSPVPPPQYSRPLVILDHVSTALNCKDASAMQSMFTHLVAWCVATSYDDGLVDIVFCNEATQSSWRGSGESVQKFGSALAFQASFRRQWAL